MQSAHFIWRVSLIGLAVAGAGAALSQEYPTRPIRIVTDAAGGGGDVTARLVAQRISGPLGQPVIVDNRQGILPGEIVSRASPDGHTLIVAGGSFYIVSLLKKTPYDPVRDFSPISLIMREVSVIVVHPSMPAKSVKELIALAKAKPGELNFGSGPLGGSTHLTGELFKAMAGVNVTHVAYKGSGPFLTALIAGEVQMAFPSATATAPHVKSGKLRALAVTSATPSPLVPGLPTVAASGLPGFESTAMTGIFAPAKTPGPIIKRLNEELVRFLNAPDVKETFFNNGAEAKSSTPEELAGALKSDLARWGKLIKDMGLRLD